MVAFLRNQQRVEHLQVAAEETEKALNLLTISFEEGEISFTGVFLLQGELATREDQLAQARGDVITSLIALYKALGGGWEIRCAPVASTWQPERLPTDQEPWEEVPTPVESVDETLPELNTDRQY